MGFNFDKHDGNSSQSGNDSDNGFDSNMPEPEDYDYQPRLYRRPYTVFEADLAEIRVLSHDQFGDTLIVGFNNAELIEGAVYERAYGEGADSGNPKKRKFKFLSYSDLGINIEDKSMDAFKDFKAEHQTEAFGKEYHWNLVGARHIYDDKGPVPEDTVAFPSTGSFEVYGDASEENGPSSEAKRLVRLLTENGRDNLNEDNFDDISGWFNTDAELAEDLVDKRVKVWTTKRPVDEDDDDNDQTYNHLTIEDVTTGDELPVRNGTSDSSSEQTQESNGTEEVAQDGDEAPWGEDDDDSSAPEFSEGVEKTIEYLVGREATEKDDIKQALGKMIEAGKVDKDEATDLDAIQAEVENRVSA